MQTKYFVLAAAMVCAVSMAANNKVSGVIKDAADKTALIGVNVSLKQGDQQCPAQSQTRTESSVWKPKRASSCWSVRTSATSQSA